MDPLSEEAPGWTPYRYGFNNPIIFTDPDGMFELDEKTAKENPELVKYLKGLSKAWEEKSDEFKDAFMEASGLSNDEVVSMLEYGSGPKLEIANLDTDTDGDGEEDRFVNGTTSTVRNKETGKLGNALDGKGLIKLDDDIIQAYKDGSSSGNSVKQGLGETLLESTLFHESTHYGNLKKNANGNGAFKESGKTFEKNAYGSDISRSKTIGRMKSVVPSPSILPRIKIKKL